MVLPVGAYQMLNFGVHVITVNGVLAKDKNKLLNLKLIVSSSSPTSIFFLYKNPFSFLCPV